MIWRIRPLYGAPALETDVGAYTVTRVRNSEIGVRYFCIKEQDGFHHSFYAGSWDEVIRITNEDKLPSP